MASLNKPKCGYCNGIITKTVSDQCFPRNCVVCGSKRMLKPRRVYQLVAKATGAPLNLYQEIDKKTFDGTDVNFHCTSCREDCFFCKKPHTAKREFSYLFKYIYLSYRYHSNLTYI